jgi:hypothetical protein
MIKNLECARPKKLHQAQNINLSAPSLVFRSPIGPGLMASHERLGSGDGKGAAMRLSQRRSGRAS